MVPRPAAVAAGAFLLVAAACFANPLYLHAPPDRGSVLLSADRTDPATGAADRSPAVTDREDLPPTARVAVRRASETDSGSYAVGRDAPPLPLRLLDAEWRYLGSQDRVATYRPDVTVGDDATTLRLTNVSLNETETDLGVTPPGRLQEIDHAKEVAWLAHESSAVVLVASFADPWRSRLERAVREGRLTVPNGNDAETFAPLDGETSFVVHDGAARRVAVAEGDANVTLSATPVDDRTLLREADVRVVETTDLPPSTRAVVVRAIERSDARAHRDAVDTERLDDLRTALIRHDGAYYVLRRGYADDFDLTPLLRVGLFALGGVSLLFAAGFGLWARRTERGKL